METINSTHDRILMILLKEPFVKQTATSLAEALGISRQGLWKSLNKLVNEGLVILEKVNNAKTGVVIVNLNWKNPIVEKTLSLILTKEAIWQERWQDSFYSLKDEASIILLFGSILNKPKEANDIDLMIVVKNKSSFQAINQKIVKIQQIQLKKIHYISLTKEEFNTELKKPNKSYLDAIKKGVVLYGQESFVEFIQKIKKNEN